MRLLIGPLLALLLASALAAAPGAAATHDDRVVVRTLTAQERRAMTPPVWRPGCPVALGALRRMSVPYVDFAGRPRRGVLVVHHSVAADVKRVMRRLYAARFPIRRMVPIERYRGSDDRGVAADNTSAFNCRRTTGSRTWSRHAYGRAIDVNPIENPYVVGGRTKWRRSRTYLDRARIRKGMAVEGGVLVRAFDAVGWEWGGRWRTPVDYQHFSYG